MYVWVDALTNYITGVGFPDESDCELALLAGRRAHHRQGHHPLPRGVLAGVPDVGRHSPCRSGSMRTASCSTGARRCRSRSATSSIPSISPTQYGVDQMRYFFLREVPFGQDGNYNHEAIVARINADLANDLGNLAQRSLSMIAKQLGGVLPEPGEFTDNDKEILAEADAMLAASRTAMATQQIHQWLNVVWSVVAEANRYFAGEAPWALAKTDPARQKTVLVRDGRSRAAGRHPDPAGDAGCVEQAARQSRRSPGRAGLRSARHTDQGRRNPAAAGRRVSALRRTKGGLSRLQAMLVDSHCHLDFPDFAEDLDAHRRARRDGRDRPHRHHLDPGEAARRAAGHRRAVSQRLLLGRHPSASRR